VDKQLDPNSDAAQFPDQNSSAESDLQYVSLKIDGEAYGGWYRTLRDGRMELLALATMHRERRTADSAAEQARAMLIEFIRTTRLKRKSEGAAEDVADAQPGESAEGTLGALLYADKSKERVPEKDWVELVAGIAEGELLALYRLFERTHRIVFTLLLRLANDWRTADELTLGVFNDVWRQASKYDARHGSVLGWVMNLARNRALNDLQFAAEPANSDRRRGVSSQHRAMRDAVARLTADERHTIEAAYFSELDYTHLAIELQQPSAIVRARIYSGLKKLRAALGAQAEGQAEVLTAATSNAGRCGQSESMASYVLHALPPSETVRAEAHVSVCSGCQHELVTFRRVVDSFAFWPTDVLRPSQTLWPRLERRIAPGAHATSALTSTSTWQRLQPKWEEVAPGISCKLLATDADNGCVSMLVRLARGTDYPPHTHAGVEELHLLHGELLIDDRKLFPGDYNRAEPGTADKRVYSETGCTCVLITSARDVLG
jgi:RNA polymerase sigma-70 factor (ECF subfamily)